MTFYYSMTNPYPQILNLQGTGLNDGDVYIGVAGQDPITNPKTVYWDDAGMIPADQPLQVSGGYIYRSGTPSAVFLSGPYSIKVLDKNGAQVYYQANVLDEVLNFITELQTDAGAGLIGFSQDATYAQGTVGDHLKRFITVTDAPFNAVGDGVADDTDAIEDALAFANGGTVYLPAGTYKITRKINLAGASLVGDGPDATIIALSQSGIGVQVGYTNAEGGTNTFSRTYSGFTIQANASTTFALFMVATIDSCFSNITVLHPSSVAAGYASFRVSGQMYGNNYINCRSRCESAAANARGFWIGNGQNEAGGPFAATNVNTFLTCYSTNAAKGFDLDNCTNSTLINPVSESGNILVRAVGNAIISPFLDGGTMIFDYYYPADGSGGVGSATQPYNNSVHGGSYAFSVTLTQSRTASFTGCVLQNVNITSGAESTKMSAVEISGTLTNNGTSGFLQYRTGGLDRMIMQSGSNTVLDISAGANSIAINGPDSRSITMTGGANVMTIALNSRPLELTGTQPQLRLPGVAVGSLPTASTYPGLRGTVTDSNAAASGNFGNVVAGGGANVVPVYSDGTNWRIG